MYLYHVCQRTNEDTSLLPHNYTWICILGILTITEVIRCCPILSPDYPMQGTDLTGDLEQLYRPRCIRWSSISSTWFSWQRHSRNRATRTSRICRRTKISRMSPSSTKDLLFQPTDQDTFSSWLYDQRHWRFGATRMSRICRRTRILRVPKSDYG